MFLQDSMPTFIKSIYRIVRHKRSPSNTHTLNLFHYKKHIFYHIGLCSIFHLKTPIFLPNIQMKCHTGAIFTVKVLFYTKQSHNGYSKNTCNKCPPFEKLHDPRGFIKNNTMT